MVAHLLRLTGKTPSHHLQYAPPMAFADDKPAIAFDHLFGVLDMRYRMDAKLGGNVLNVG